MKIPTFPICPRSWELSNGRRCGKLIIGRIWVEVMRLNWLQKCFIRKWGTLDTGECDRHTAANNYILLHFFCHFRFALSCYPQYQNEDGPLMSLDFKLKSLGKIKYHGPEELPDGHFHFYASGTPFVCYKNGKIIDCRNEDGSRKTFNLKNFGDVTFRLSGSLPKTLQVGFYITIVEAISE